MKKRVPATAPIAKEPEAANQAVNPVVTKPSLEHLRSDSLRVRADAAQTIVDLEAWRDEIDATIAFLKAQRK